MLILKKIGSIILSIIIVLIAFIFSIAIIMMLTDVIMVENDYLFYEHNQITGELLIALAVIPAIFISVKIIEKLKISSRKQIEKNEELIYVWNRLGLFKIPIIVIYLICFYICFTNITVVTDSEIIVRTPFNPAGKIYEYSEVESIETGFGNKTFACAEYQEEGSFYYIIELDDKEVIFSAPTPNDKVERYNKASYLELEEFDSKLVELGISKKSSDNGCDKCYYDEDIVQRFLKIINNK
jgi:hypothetical protein